MQAETCPRCQQLRALRRDDGELVCTSEVCDRDGTALRGLFVTDTQRFQPTWPPVPPATHLPGALQRAHRRRRRS